MLAGFEDLERLARLETGAADMPAPQADTDLAALLARQIAQLDPVIGRAKCGCAGMPLLRRCRSGRPPQSWSTPSGACSP
jgi:hypothetical protein